MRIARLLPVLLVATGCTSFKTSLKQQAADLSPGKGVVVFSTGASDTHYIGSTMGLLLVWRSASGAASSIGTDALIDNGYIRSQFEDEYGQVRMAVLDEGPYCFIPVMVSGTSRLVDPPSFAFRVKAGAVTYIGSLYLDGGRMMVRLGKRTRDMDAALAAHPELAKLPAEFEPAALFTKCSNSF